MPAYPARTAKNARPVGEHRRNSRCTRKKTFTLTVTALRCCSETDAAAAARNPADAADCCAAESANCSAHAPAPPNFLFFTLETRACERSVSARISAGGFASRAPACGTRRTLPLVRTAIDDADDAPRFWPRGRTRAWKAPRPTPPPVLHASAAFLEVLLELLEDRGGANHIIQSWDTSTCVIEVFFEVVQQP